MPNSILMADTSFPQFTRETSDSEKIEQITSYLFVLLEQLRYSIQPRARRISGPPCSPS